MATTTIKRRLELRDDDVVLGADGLPVAIRVFSVGDNLAVNDDCRNAVYDPRDAAAIVAAHTRGDGRVPIDLAHAMVNPHARTEDQESFGDGLLRADDTGIWIDDIRWRETFKPKLRDRAWRYFSPTFTVDREERSATEGMRARITSLETVSLTNIPASVDAPPIVRAKDVRSGAERVRPDGIVTRMSETNDKESRDDASLDYTKLNEDEREEAFVRMQAALKAAKKDADEGDDEDAEDDEDEDDEGEKRSLVHALIRDGLASYKELKALVAMRSKDLELMDAKLRQNAKAGDRRSGRIDEKQPDTAVEPGALKRRFGRAYQDPRSFIARRLGIPVDQLKEGN